MSSDNLNDNYDLKQIDNIAYCMKKAFKLSTIYPYINEDSHLYNRLIKKIENRVDISIGLIATTILFLSFIPLAVIDKYNDILMASLFFAIFLLGSFLFCLVSSKQVEKIQKRLIKKAINRRARKAQHKTAQILNLEDYKDKITKKALEISTEEEYIDKITFSLFSEISTEIILSEEDELFQDRIKRLIFTIISGNFVLESLNLENVIKNEKLKTYLLDILDKIEIVSARFFEKRELSIFKDDFETITKSIRDIKGIINTLDNIFQNKEFAANIESITSEFKSQLDIKPVAKSNIELLQIPEDSEKENLLSSITAMDSDIVEIRTKAGTYYTKISHFDQEVLDEIRELELLTDKELEVKIEVLKSTISELENDEILETKIKEEIKKEYLKKQFSAQQALKKRSGKSKTITCPYCNKKTSSIKRVCSKCQNELPFCIICLNTIGVGDEIKICPNCKNIAHAEHFDSWLKKSQNCPVCKKEIAKKLKVEKLAKVSKASS